MNLGSRLKLILSERQMTVTRFAKEADLPAQTVYALINRDSNKADMDILMKLLAALDMDFFTFMGAEGPSHTAEPDASDAPERAAEAIVEKVVEKEVEKVVIKEVPAAAPEGKTALYINTDTYEKILSLAAEEDISDEHVIAQAIESYMEQGFDYRQRPLRSIFRDLKPHSGRSKDMDSFLL